MATQTETKNNIQIGLADDDLRNALRDIFVHYGYDRSIWSDAAKNEIAALLSQIAGKNPPWSGLYIHNFMTGGVQAGRAFKASILGLAAIIDGMPVQLIKGRTVQVTALGNIRPGAIVYGDSRKCANIACYINFVPRVWNQRYCSPECKKASHKLAAVPAPGANGKH